eukprot:38468-Rhodomonas_salina.8
MELSDGRVPVPWQRSRQRGNRDRLGTVLLAGPEEMAEEEERNTTKSIAKVRAGRVVLAAHTAM